MIGIVWRNPRNANEIESAECDYLLSPTTVAAQQIRSTEQKYTARQGGIFGRMLPLISGSDSGQLEVRFDCKFGHFMVILQRKK